MLSNNTTFNKDNLDLYLKELAKEYRKINGKQIRAEIILVGGASILANYGFRDMTTNMDAIIYASSSMKEAINHVGDKYNLPNGWLNSDFVNSESYSHKLIEVSKHYKTFSNVVDIRTVSGEYLVAMKLRSARKYKNDISDVIGILKEHIDMSCPLTYDKINYAVCKLYGGWKEILDYAKEAIISALDEVNLDESYENKRKEEIEVKSLLVDFDNEYPHVLKESNLNSVLEAMKRKQKENMK